MAQLRPIYIHVPGRASSKRQVVYMVKEQGKEKCQRQEESSISGWLMLFFFLLIGWEVGLFSTSLFLTPFSVIEKGASSSTRKSTSHLSLGTCYKVSSTSILCVCAVWEKLLVKKVRWIGNRLNLINLLHSLPHLVNDLGRHASVSFRVHCCVTTGWL